ncbi:MAG: RNA-binding protein [Treponema sp.]|nr:RNA-binding protein [Treponema sp.]
MSKRIYIGNLSYSTKEDSLTSYFSEYGEVLSAVIIKDKFTEQSKGFGFVEMSEEPAAQNAITALNGREIDGRKVRVNFAEEKPHTPRRVGV